MAKITKTFQYGKHTVTLETGELARQPSAPAIANVAATELLFTAAPAKSPPEGRASSRLTVDKVEKF